MVLWRTFNCLLIRGSVLMSEKKRSLFFNSCSRWKSLRGFTSIQYFHHECQMLHFNKTSLFSWRGKLIPSNFQSDTIFLVLGKIRPEIPFHHMHATDMVYLLLLRIWNTIFKIDRISTYIAEYCISNET